MKAVSVSQLNTYIKRILSTDPILCNIAVKGEVSNLTKHASGHWYFSLKDDDSRINCFLPSSRVPSLRFDLDEGMEITAFGNVSVYERGGSYSLQIRDIEAEGEGTLKQAFEKLKRKLEEEGLFDPAHKRPIPSQPRRIGVVTSPTGAAIRDIISTVRRRNPSVDILLYPALVQGEGSAKSVCEGIETLNSKFPELDLLIVGRGGGSAEDLWTFNEESVARAVYASKIPVISAVGHEIDYVITDYVADLRGATPTAAAELAVPHIDTYKDRLRRLDPKILYGYLEEHVFDLERRLKIIKMAIDASDPGTVLSKGFAVVQKGDDYISDISKFSKGDTLKVRFAKGALIAKVTEVLDE